MTGNRLCMTKLPPQMQKQEGLGQTQKKKEKEVPKFVAGMSALCGGCGYLSEDFNKCIRCSRKLPKNVKAVVCRRRAEKGQQMTQPSPVRMLPLQMQKQGGLGQAQKKRKNMNKKDVSKFVPGMFAICGGCGYLSEDFNKCIRCSRKLPENVKAVVNRRAEKGHRRGVAGPTSQMQKQGGLGQAHGTQSVAEPLPAIKPPKTPSPETVKEVPKFVPGMLALCGGCGYFSEDFNKCTRCSRKLPKNVKAVRNLSAKEGHRGGYYAAESC